jgi:glyoxylate utilization-related uncharacterized protein
MKIQGTNISMTRGDSEAIKVIVKDTLGNIIPLITGDTIYFTVRENILNTTKFIEKIITEFDDGKALININPQDTNNLRFTTYVYDIQLNKENGTVKTIISPSRFTITGEVTYD